MFSRVRRMGAHQLPKVTCQQVSSPRMFFPSVHTHNTKPIRNCIPLNLEEAKENVVYRAFSVFPHATSGEQKTKESSTKSYFGTLGSILCGSLFFSDAECAALDDLESEHGNKYTGLVVVAKHLQEKPLAGVVVPLPKGLSHSSVKAFLSRKAPHIFREWNKLGKLFIECQNKELFFSDPKVALALETIQNQIVEAFSNLSNEDLVFFPEEKELVSWIKELKERGSYLMVRSSGIEDSNQMANAGGNLSEEYIPAEPKAILSSCGRVIASYFGIPSLRNRIEAGTNPFLAPLLFSVLLQELIGESVGGAEDSKDIPISLVLFTTEPTDSEEDFHVVKISAALGHGSGVVSYGNVGCDRMHLIRSKSNPKEILEAYQNRYKEMRLAPISDKITGKVSLELIKNPNGLQKKRALDKEMVSRLTLLAEYLEEAFEGKPIDTEIVIKRGIIHIVQARPVIRQIEESSYLSDELLEKLEKLGKSPLLEDFPIKVLVSGKGSAKVIFDSKEILVCDSLKQAEDTPGSKNRALVIVGTDEENTHPIVNFSSHGVTCLYTQDLDQIKKLIKQVSPLKPLVICPQSGRLYLWDRAIANPMECIQAGTFSHPAPLAISFEEEGTPFPFEPVQNGKAPPEIHAAITSLKASTTAAVASQALDKLKQIASADIQKTKHQYSILGQETSPIIKKLETVLERTFEELEQNPSPRKRQLFLIKTLETLLSGQPSGSLYTYSLLDVKKLSRQADKILSYRTKLPPNVVPHWESFLSIGESAVSKEGEAVWEKFLLSLEKEPFSPEMEKKKEAFQNLIKTLHQNHSLELFFNGLCLPALAQDESSFKDLEKFLSFFSDVDFPILTTNQDPLTLFESFLSLISKEDTIFLDTLDEKNKKLAQIKTSLSSFEDPKNFESSWKELKTLLSFFSEKDFIQTMQSSSKLSQMIATATLKELVEVTDKAIKNMKKSSNFSVEEKSVLLSKMLKMNFLTLKAWLTSLIPQDQIHLYKDYSLSLYLNMIDAQLDDATSLDPSRGFSVNGAVINSFTDFRRHIPETLEDIFTLIHQNLIFVTSTLSRSLLPNTILDQIPTAPLFQKAITQLQDINIENTTSAILYGVDMAESGITCHYNIPLRNHSAMLSIEQQKNGSLFLHIKMVGLARNRWDFIGNYIKALNHTKGLSLNKPIDLGEQELSFSWVVRNDKDLLFAKEHFLSFLEFSMGGNNQKNIEHLTSEAKKRNLFNPIRNWYIQNQVNCPEITGPLLPKDWNALLQQIQFNNPQLDRQKTIETILFLQQISYVKEKEDLKDKLSQAVIQAFDDFIKTDPDLTDVIDIFSKLYPLMKESSHPYDRIKDYLRKKILTEDLTVVNVKNGIQIFGLFLGNPLEKNPVDLENDIFEFVNRCLSLPESLIYISPIIPWLVRDSYRFSIFWDKVFALEDMQSYGLSSDPKQIKKEIGWLICFLELNKKIETTLNDRYYQKGDIKNKIIENAIIRLIRSNAEFADVAEVLWNLPLNLNIDANDFMVVLEEYIDKNLIVEALFPKDFEKATKILLFLLSDHKGYSKAGEFAKYCAILPQTQKYAAEIFSKLSFQNLYTKEAYQFLLKFSFNNIEYEEIKSICSNLVDHHQFLPELLVQAKKWQISDDKRLWDLAFEIFSDCLSKKEPIFDIYKQEAWQFTMDWICSDNYRKRNFAQKMLDVIMDPFTGEMKPEFIANVITCANLFVGLYTPTAGPDTSLKVAAKIFKNLVNKNCAYQESLAFATQYLDKCPSEAESLLRALIEKKQYLSEIKAFANKLTQTENSLNLKELGQDLLRIIE